MKNRYFVQLSYKGTQYHGWQVQPNAVSVQESLNEAFSKIFREKIEITGAGRTDTGVHAINYIAHFDSEKDKLDCDNKIIFKLNSYLPNDIAIHKIMHVIPEAHARFDAISRTYHYRIHQHKDPFLKEISWFYPFKLDIELMNKAAELLLTFTDFTSFSKLHTDVKTNHCRIAEAKWLAENNHLTFVITADRFLRNMVRAIVGTLLDVGKNKISLIDFIQIIENKNRSDAGLSVPAHGLFLMQVAYPDKLFL